MSPRTTPPTAALFVGLALSAGCASAPATPAPSADPPAETQPASADPDDDLPDEATSGRRFAGPQPGELAPSLASLEWYRGEPPATGEPYVLFFWGTWCKPCKAAVPALVTNTTARHLTVIAVSRDTRDGLDAFFDTWSDRFPIRVAIDPAPHTVHRTYEAWTVPRFVYVDGTGHVYRVVYGVQALDSL